MTKVIATRRRGLTAFLALAFGIAWVWEVVAHLLLGWSLGNPLVQAPAAFAPAIAAVVVRRWVTRDGFGDAASRPRLRASWPLYLLAWVGPLAVAAVVVGAAAVTGHADLSALPEPPLLLLLAVAAVGTFAFWGEEFGWTGYLLVRVCPGRPRRAAIVAGLIAAVWHFPLAFLGYTEFRHLAYGLAGWTLWIVCQEVLLAWLRARSGSVWPACLAHAGNNFVLVPLTSAALSGPGGFGPEGQQLLIVVVLAALAAGPLLREPASSEMSRAA